MSLSVLNRTIPESLPWLLSKGRVQEAEAIVRRAARFNNREIPENIFQDHIHSPEMKVDGPLLNYKIIDSIQNDTVFSFSQCWMRSRQWRTVIRPSRVMTSRIERTRSSTAFERPTCVASASAPVCSGILHFIPLLPVKCLRMLECVAGRSTLSSTTASRTTLPTCTETCTSTFLSVRWWRFRRWPSPCGSSTSKQPLKLSASKF